MKANMVLGALVSLTIVGVGGVWIYGHFKDMELRERMFTAHMERRRRSEPPANTEQPSKTT